MFMNHFNHQTSSSSRVNFQLPMLNSDHSNSCKAHNPCTFENVEVLGHVCPVCDKTFRASSLLDIHMRVHVGAKPFVCPVCNHRATQKGNLKLHMKKHHGQDLPTHIDLVPDSGIWGNIPSAVEHIEQVDQEQHLNSKKKFARAHSSLLNENVVELIKKCQNNIGQSTMGRITESLNDFLDMAQKKNGGNSTPYVALTSPSNGDSNNSELESRWKVASVINQHHIVNHSNANMQYPDKFFAEQGFHDSNDNLKIQTVEDANTFCYCKICGWKTSSSGYLNVHMRKHKAESHVCRICGRAFKETWYLKNHMRSHINDLAYESGKSFGETNYHCDVSMSIRQANDHAHLNGSHDTDQRKLTDVGLDINRCTKCGMMFEKHNMQTHIEMCGRIKVKNETCELCTSEESKFKHIFMESLGLKSHCSIEKTVPSVSGFNPVISLKVLRSTEKRSNESRFLSDRLKDSILNLKKEIITYDADNDEEMTKENIKKLLKSSEILSLVSQLRSKNGNKLNSSKETNLQCEDLFLRDLNALSDNTENTSLSYRNPSMQSLASIGKSLAVNACSAQKSNSFENVAGNDQHPFGYQCRFCSKWFKYRSVLGIHMRSHTGERPYKCPYCGYAGTQHNCLKLHIQRHHPNQHMEYHDNQSEVNYTKTDIDIAQGHMLLGHTPKFLPARCPICGRVSPSPGYLKIHMRSHKKTLDHVCHICGRGFKEYWYLSTHLRTHDREMNFPPPKSDSVHVRALIEPSQSMQTTLRNTLLSKRQSFPIAKETSLAGHSYLSGTASWNSLDTQENSPSIHLQHPVRSEGNYVMQSNVSKRKAFRPSRHMAEPYNLPQETTRSRKSKPRKLTQDPYLSPASLNSSCASQSDEIYVTAFSTETMKCDITGDEKPLDLRVTAAVVTSLPSECLSLSDISDEPLNLAIK